MKKYCIIGSGRQGTATAYDIVMYASPESLTIIDSNTESLNRCRDKIKDLTDYDLQVIELDISSEELLLK